MSQPAMSICEECRQNGGLIPTMEQIAKESAEAVIELHKRDMEIRLHTFKDEVVSELDKKLGARLQAFLGEQSPHQHYEAHRRLDRLLTALDGLQGSIISKAVMAGIWVMIGAGVVLTVFWERIIG